MKYSIKVNEVRAKEGSNIKGFATVVFGDSFKITNIAILENKDKVFAHIHVSYIINLGHIRAIEGDEVVMDNEERLLIARSHKQNLKEKHMEFVRRMV